MTKTGSPSASIVIFIDIAKKYRKPKKEKKIRKCYKCDKVEHLAKDCRSEQKIKNRNTQEESYNKDKNNNDIEAGFVRGLE